MVTPPMRIAFKGNFSRGGKTQARGGISPPPGASVEKSLDAGVYFRVYGDSTSSVTARKGVVPACVELGSTFAQSWSGHISAKPQANCTCERGVVKVSSIPWRRQTRIEARRFCRGGGQKASRVSWGGQREQLFACFIINRFAPGSSSFGYLTLWRARSAC